MKIDRLIALASLALLFCFQLLADTTPFSCSQKKSVLQSVSSALADKLPKGSDSIQSLQQEYDKKMADYIILQGIKQLRENVTHAVAKIEVDDDKTTQSLDNFAVQLKEYSNAIGSFGLIETTINDLIASNGADNQYGKKDFDSHNISNFNQQKANNDFFALCKEKGQENIWCKDSETYKQLFNDFMTAYAQASAGDTRAESLDRLKNYKDLLNDSFLPVYSSDLIIEIGNVTAGVAFSIYGQEKNILACQKGSIPDCTSARQVMQEQITKIKEIKAKTHLSAASNDQTLTNIENRLIALTTPANSTGEGDSRYKLDAKQKSKILASYSKIKDLAAAHGTTDLPDFKEEDESLYTQMVNRLQTIKLFNIPECKGPPEHPRDTLKVCFDKLNSKEMDDTINEELTKSTNDLKTIADKISKIRNSPKTKELFDMQELLARIVLQECSDQSEADISQYDASCESCYIDSILPKDQRGLILSASKALVTLDPTLLKSTVSDAQKSQLFSKLCKDKRFNIDIDVDCQHSVAVTAYHATYDGMAYNPKTKQLERQDILGPAAKSMTLAAGDLLNFYFTSDMAVRSTVFNTNMYNAAMTIQNQNTAVFNSYTQTASTVYGITPWGYNSGCTTLFSLGCSNSWSWSTSGSFLSY